MSTNKSLNYIDNQNTPRTAAGKALNKENFSISAISDILNEVKNNNQHINTIVEETNADVKYKFNTNGTNICYKMESDAQGIIISENQTETLQTKPRITNSMTNLSAYNGSNIPVKGQCTLDIQHRSKNVPLLFIVADANSPPIKREEKIKLSKRILSISNSQKCNILNKHKDCFGETGTLPKGHHITIDQNITTGITKTILSYGDRP